MSRLLMAYALRDLVVAPQTFAKPKPVETAATPAVGAPAPGFPEIPSKPTVIAFLRHVGCPFAEVTMRRLVGLSATHPTITFIAVTHSPAGPSRAWCDAIGGAGAVRLVEDPDRAHYAAWGVGPSDREHFAGKASMAAVRRLALEGTRNRVGKGSRWQTAATFAINTKGIVVWRHQPAHAGDLPPLEEALASLPGRPGQ